MTGPEWEKLVKDLMAKLHTQCKEFVEDTGGQPPLLIQVFSDRRELIDMMTYLDDKDLMEVMIKAYQMQEGVIGTIFVSEAWMAVFDKETEFVRPVNSPDREEVLFFLAEGKGGTFAARALMTRDEKDKVTVGPLQHMSEPGEKITGRFVGNQFKN
jgi:hypothetical protein